MKKILFILSVLQLILGSEIKEKTLQVINNYYNQDIEIQESKFKIPKEVKKQIQNQIKQKFYRDQIYYWTCLLYTSPSPRD